MAERARAASSTAAPEAGLLFEEISSRVEAGARLVGLYGTAGEDAATTVTVVLAEDAELELYEVTVTDEYPALTPSVPAAFWYERVLHDQFGVLPVDHPRLDPLVLAGMQDGAHRPAAPPRPGERGRSAVTTSGAGGRPGDPRPASLTRLFPSEQALPRYLHGEGLFTIPHGPVRSGVVESLEFLIETPGEDIPRLQMRVFAKHRGVEISFEGRHAITDGVAMAERVEGTASVAHAVAYCRALETLAGMQVPREADLIRMLHAELERIAGHLEVIARLCESAALAVGLAKFSGYKEQVQRLRHDLCGSRFGRGVVIPGGVAAQELGTHRHPDQRVHALRRAINHDRDLLMVTSSFLDRLRGTGFLDPDRAAEAGAVGPVGRASGNDNDVRADRPYGAYRELGVTAASPPHASLGDVQARLEVRLLELETSFDLVEHALTELTGFPEHELSWARPISHLQGRSTGSVEGPQGEIVYAVEVGDDRLVRVWPRTASMHNLMLFHDVFHLDVLTDFPFIEASFAVSNAGVVL